MFGEDNYVHAVDIRSEFTLISSRRVRGSLATRIFQRIEKRGGKGGLLRVELLVEKKAFPSPT